MFFLLKTSQTPMFWSTPLPRTLSFTQVLACKLSNSYKLNTNRNLYTAPSHTKEMLNNCQKNHPKPMSKATLSQLWFLIWTKLFVRSQNRSPMLRDCCFHFEMVQPQATAERDLLNRQKNIDRPAQCQGKIHPPRRAKDAKTMTFRKNDKRKHHHRLRSFLWRAPPSAGLGGYSKIFNML